MMDLSEISTLLGTALSIFTALGGAGAVMYRKQNRRLKEAETRLAEVSVTRGKVEAQKESWHIFKEQNESLSAMNQQLIERNQKLVDMSAAKEDEWGVRFDKQTDRLREVQRALVAANDREIELTRRLGAAERERDHYKQWMCKRPWKLCKEREPEQEIKHDKYVPLGNNG